MLKTERHACILEHVSARGAMDVTELSRLLKVSGATIRRDLQQLSRQNLLRRTHGGAVLGGAALRGAGPELPVPHRSGHRRAEKQAIARAAAELVPEGAVVGMTGGTTVTEIARVLAARGRVTIVTNAVNIAAEMVPHKNVTLVVVGGSARTESYELVGPIAEKTLADHHTDVTFLGVDGVGADHGCTTHDQLEAATDRAFLASSDRTVVVADHSKIGRVTFAKICPLRDIDRLVTDAAAPAAVLADIMDAGVAVTVV